MALGRREFGLGALAAAGVSLAPPAVAQPIERTFSFKDVARRKGLIYGAAIEPEEMDNDPAYRALVQEQCALIVPMNAMKWNQIREREGEFNFTRGDRFMAIAAEMRMRVHAHNLIWHEGLPKWFPREMTRDQAVAQIEEHVSTVVSRYKGRIQSWDVICEGVMPDGPTQNPWMKAVGLDYMRVAFETAHAADPKCILGIEEYGLEYDHIQWMVEKRASALNIIDTLQKQKAPIHALGIQSQLVGHEPNTFGDGFRQFLRDVARRGLKIYVSEMDVRDQRMVADVAARDAAIAETYKRYLDAVLSETAVYMVNNWELSDKYTAKVFMDARPDGLPVRPTPFDRDFNAKPAAYATLAALVGTKRR